MKTATTVAPSGTSSEFDTESALKLWIVLSRAYSSVDRSLQPGLAANEVTPGEFGILEVLHHKGRLLLGEIQKKVLVSSGGITYLVDRLVEKGLVKREDCPSDRRARYAVLTPEGTELMRQVFPAHAQDVARALSGLTLEEQQEATKLLRKLGLAAAKLSSP